jgi:hypothetical protein
MTGIENAIQHVEITSALRVVISVSKNALFMAEKWSCRSCLSIFTAAFTPHELRLICIQTGWITKAGSEGVTVHSISFQQNTGFTPGDDNIAITSIDPIRMNRSAMPFAPGLRRLITRM